MKSKKENYIFWRNYIVEELKIEFAEPNLLMYKYTNLDNTRDNNDL